MSTRHVIKSTISNAAWRGVEQPEKANVIVPRQVRERAPCGISNQSRAETRRGQSEKRITLALALEWSGGGAFLDCVGIGFDRVLGDMYFQCAM